MDFLLSTGLSLRGKFISLLGQNPFTYNAKFEGRKLVKLRIKDVPLSVANDTIKTYIETIDGIEFASEIKFENIRAKAGKLTACRNGNRFFNDRQTANV